MTTKTPARPIDKVRKAWAEGLRPDRKISADEWAEQHRVLPPDAPEAGMFRNARTPYLIDIMRTMSPDSPYREGWWMKPHQVGGSVTGENLIGTWICAAAGSILVVFPTLEDGRQWELQRFEPMRANTRELRRRIRPADERSSDNTKLRKKYPGGVMRLVGANRVGALKSATYRYVKFEEPDEYPASIGEQGSPIDLARARTTNFGRRAKIYGDGTPTLDGFSAIQQQALRGDRRRWHLFCPDCAQPQVLVWEQLRWVDGDPSSARYACEACGALNDEATWKKENYRPRPPGMTEAEARASGRAYWEASAPGEPGVASWLDFEALAAPLGWRPWSMLVTEYVAAQDDEEKLRTFVNIYRGKPYRDTQRASVGVAQLQARAENYPLMQCPAGGLLVVAGVDTQDDRLAVVIRAYGRGEESWGLHHGEIYGDPSAREVWDKLRELLEAPIRHASGQTIRVDAAAIDSGGHHAEDVYAFTRDAQLRGKHWIAIRGAKPYDAPKLGRPKPVEFNYRGRPVPGGALLTQVGTQAIKNLIDGRLRAITQAGPGYLHFPLGFEADYYRQLRAERRIGMRNKRGERELWWVKGSERNEAWDCEVYAYAAYLYVMHGRHPEQVWRQRERVYAPPSPDLFDRGEAASEQAPPREPALSAPETADAVAPPGQAAAIVSRRRGLRRPGFATHW